MAQDVVGQGAESRFALVDLVHCPVVYSVLTACSDPMICLVHSESACSGHAVRSVLVACSG